MRRIVVAWKERGLRRLAAPLALVVAEVVPCPAADALCALPPDPERKLKRGHDPPAALTAELARHWNLPVEPLLARPRASPQQRGLPLRQRRRNVAQAFVARGRSPARLVLVDDVYTTGSTVDAAARELRRAGARRVEVVTLARAVRRG